MRDFICGKIKKIKPSGIRGSAFGACGDGHVRISYAYSIEALKEAMSCLARFVEKIRFATSNDGGI